VIIASGGRRRQDGRPSDDRRLPAMAIVGRGGFAILPGSPRRMVRPGAP